MSKHQEYRLMRHDCTRRRQGCDFTLLGEVNCLRNAEMNVEGKSGPPRNEVSWQPILCTRGSGARPGKYDRTVFGTELYSDDMVCYGRHQIEGVADESKLPQWARMETEAEKPNQKQSILGELDALIKEAAELAERKGGANTKKRGDLEVD